MPRLAVVRTLRRMLGAIRADFVHYCEVHRARTFGERLLVPLRAPSLWALAVHRFGKWLPSAPRAVRLPLKAVHRVLFEVVRHLTGVLIQPYAEIEERVWLASFAPLVLGPKRICAGAQIHAGVTLGNGLSKDAPGVPVIGRDVVVGPGAIIVGPVQVPDGSVVGPNTLLTTSPPAAAAFLGAPFIKTKRAPDLLVPEVP